MASEGLKGGGIKKKNFRELPFTEVGGVTVHVTLVFGSRGEGRRGS